MERQLPPPYKFLVIRKERDEWMLAHVSTFDCAEPPSMPILGTNELDRKDTRFQLAVYPTAALVFIENTIEKINASPSLEGTGCKYCILGADTAKKDDNWENICLVLKLANCNDSFKAIVGDPEYLSMRKYHVTLSRTQSVTQDVSKSNSQRASNSQVSYYFGYKMPTA
ncbi:hypothetical protein TWF703_010763 [Orbilia oligospora]|uniref:Uncharacterized protein n=1 Tax=Orbilia oligospora TaxID=2813651 RepID=A0A7C8PAG0_ORBOL|nr:hypothetical protein TWF703_010763 [Orbilia oligospora]